MPRQSHLLCSGVVKQPVAAALRIFGCAAIVGEVKGGWGGSGKGSAVPVGLLGRWSFRHLDRLVWLLQQRDRDPVRSRLAVVVGVAHTGLEAAVIADCQPSHSADFADVRVKHPIIDRDRKGNSATFIRSPFQERETPDWKPCS